MRMTAGNLVNIVFTVLLVKCPAQETGTGPMSGWIQDGAKMDSGWIKDVLSKSKNVKWDTGESISSLKNLELR